MDDIPGRHAEITPSPSRFERTIGLYGVAQRNRRGVLAAIAVTALAVAVVAVTVITDTRGTAGVVAFAGASVALCAAYWYLWSGLMGATYRWVAAKNWTDTRRTAVWFSAFWDVVIATVAAIGVVIELGN